MATNKPGKVGKLNKALYGLLEAARVWREDLKEKLKTLGYIPLESDTGVFMHKIRNRHLSNRHTC